MSFCTCFDWFKKLVIYQWTESKNRRHSQSVACRCHPVISFKWGTFGVIKIYFRLFALFWKNKYIFQYHSKKVWIEIRIDQNYLFGSFEITSIRLYTPLRNPLRKLDDVYNLIEVISSYNILPKGMQRFTLLIL